MDDEKKLFLFCFLAFILIVVSLLNVRAALSNSSNYKITAFTVSSGGKNTSSANYKTDIATGTLSGASNSSSYKSFMGFWYTGINLSGIGNVSIKSLSITPNPAYTNDTLNCSGTYNNTNSNKGNVTFSWYNGSTLFWQVTQFNKFSGEQVNEPLTWINRTGLVGYWKFSEGNGTVAYDISNNGVIPNNGTLTSFDFNANSGWVDGKFGKALSFDGVNDYVALGNSPISNSTNTFTVALWAKANQLNKWQRLYNIAPHDGVIQLAGTLQGMDNKWRWFDYNMNLPYPNLAWDVQSDVPAIVGIWYHVVGVNDGTTAKLYINGALQTMTFAIKSVAISGAVTIATGNTEYFNGSIDEVRIYNRSLTSGEISEIYNNSPHAKGETWNCTINATDSQGDAGLPNSITITISDLAPSIPEIGGPDNASRTIGNSQTLRCANSTDEDGDTINYVFYMDTNTPSTTMRQNSTATTYTFSTNDGWTYYWRCKAEDGAGGVSAFTAQKTFTENTQPTSINMVYPADGSTTTNRTPQFNWTASTDAEGDSVTYQINVTCYSSCSADNRLPNSSTSQNWITITSRLKNFWDDNYYYNWTVRPWDGYEFGVWNSVPYTLKLSSLVSLSMINSGVNFSVLNMGETANTTTNNPIPLSIRNDGNSFVSVNMSNEG